MNIFARGAIWLRGIIFLTLKPDLDNSNVGKHIFIRLL